MSSKRMDHSTDSKPALGIDSSQISSEHEEEFQEAHA